MATLTQLTLDADGTKDTSNLSHDAGTGDPWVGHCNDAPDGVSSDFVQNNTGLSDGSYEAWFSLSNVDSDFDSMDGLNIDVDVGVVGTAPDNDTCALTARIFAADNDTGNPLTAETASLGTEADTSRTQRNVVFGTLAGTKAQWDAAHIRFTWLYNRVAGADNYSLRFYGCDIDGTYTVTSSEIDTRNKRFSMMNVGKYWVGVLPNPDGTIDAADRALFLWMYAGITLDGAGLPIPVAFIHYAKMGHA